MQPRRPFAVVTGATSGFGAAAVRHLARSGHDVCLVARNVDRTASIEAELAECAPDASVMAVLGDLSSFEDVERIADEVLDHGRPIAVLLNNAGAIFGFRRQESVDGIEMTFALNHFAYHHLTVKLLPLVTGAELGRIINVASDAYESAGGRFDFDGWSAERGYRPFRQYARSKLANILFTKALAERLEHLPVGCVAWSPNGLTATRFAHGVNRLAPVAMAFARPFAKKTSVAVTGLLELCDRPLGPDDRGAFFVDHTIDPALVAPIEDASRLWDLTTELLHVPPAHGPGARPS